MSGSDTLETEADVRSVSIVEDETRTLAVPAPAAGRLPTGDAIAAWLGGRGAGTHHG